jgi:hypothetical protein
LRKQLPDIDEAISNMKAAWPVHVIPLVEIRSIFVKNLNTMVFPVGHIHLSLAISADTVGKVK